MGLSACSILFVSFGIYVILVLAGVAANPMPWIYSRSFVRHCTPTSWKRFFTADEASNLSWTDSSEDRNDKLFSISSLEGTFEHFRIPQTLPKGVAYFKCDLCEGRLESGEWVYGNRQLNLDACLLCQESLGEPECRRELVDIYEESLDVEYLEHRIEEIVNKLQTSYFVQVIDYLKNKVNQLMSTPAQERVELVASHTEDIGAIVRDEEVHFSAYPIKRMTGCGWCCDLCDSDPADGTLEYGNKDLNIGCCEECFKHFEAHGSAGLRQCQALLLKKGFAFQKVPSEGPIGWFKRWHCDLCEEHLSKGDEVFGSRELNVDACMHCVKRSNRDQLDRNQIEIAAHLRVLAAEKGNLPGFNACCSRDCWTSCCLPFDKLRRKLTETSNGDGGDGGGGSN